MFHLYHIIPQGSEITEESGIEKNYKYCSEIHQRNSFSQRGQICHIHELTAAMSTCMNDTWTRSSQLKILTWFRVIMPLVKELLANDDC